MSTSPAPRQNIGTPPIRLGNSICPAHLSKKGIFPNMTDLAEVLKQLAKNQHLNQTINDCLRVMDLLRAYETAENEWPAFDSREQIRRELDLPTFPSDGSHPRFTDKQIETFQRKATHYVKVVEGRLENVKAVADEAKGRALPTGELKNIFAELSDKIEESIQKDITKAKNEISAIKRAGNYKVLDNLRELSKIFTYNTSTTGLWSEQIEQTISGYQETLHRTNQGFQRGIL